ncbi:MAG: hypothetical protein IJP29_07060 [Lachnospiraceae bacterium]|nr:hypothetical protein [Lachnospiraceae bacterium]
MKKQESNIQEKHSIYYNCSADEVVKKHMRKTRVTGWTSIVILVALLVYILFQKLTLATWGLVLIEVIVFLICKLLVHVRTMHLRDIFVFDCDPIKFYDVMDVLEKKVKKQRAKSTIFLYKAQCCRCIKERETEGLEYLKKVKFKKLTMQAESIRLNEFANYSVLNKDRPSFDAVKKDLEKLPNRIHKQYKTEKQLYQQVMNYVTLHELMWDERNTEARELANHLLDQQTTTLNKVGIHMKLAKLDIVDDEYVNAKAHLDYVVAHGNLLSVVDEARALLDKCVL